MVLSQAGSGDEVLDNLSLEVRRGAVVIAVLAAVRHEQYGYSLKTALSEEGVAIDEGTLYPLLRRLEAQGVLDSRWDTSEGRPRRYYRLNQKGARLLKALEGEWKTISTGVNRLLRS